MVTQIRILLTTLISLISTSCNAQTSLGEIANTLSGGTSVISEILVAACVVVGVCLLGTAITQFQVHRNNPKLVPLINPLLYLVLGVILVCLPFLLNYLDDNDSAPGSYPEATAAQYDIDAPLE